MSAIVVLFSYFNISSGKLRRVPSYHQGGYVFQLPVKYIAASAPFFRYCKRLKVFCPWLGKSFFQYRPLPAEFQFSFPALPAELHVLFSLSIEKSSAITFKVYDVLWIKRFLLSLHELHFQDSWWKSSQFSCSDRKRFGYVGFKKHEHLSSFFTLVIGSLLRSNPAGNLIGLVVHLFWFRHLYALVYPELNCRSYCGC